MADCVKILGTNVHAVQIPEVLNKMQEWIKNKDFGNYICISNINDVAAANKNDLIKEATNSASLSVPDGMSLVILANLYAGSKLKKRVYGPDLMNDFLKISEEKEYSHFFYGATENTLSELNKKVKNQIPNLKIVGFYSPPFKELSRQEEEGIINMINEANPDVVWVGLGCPKQQVWMYKHRNELKVPVMVGVGAAFDFLAGTKPQAPRWIRDNGFEWLFRLITEPKRLWKRYLIGGFIFIGLFFKGNTEWILKHYISCISICCVISYRY